MSFKYIFITKNKVEKIITKYYIIPDKYEFKQKNKQLKL